MRVSNVCGRRDHVGLQFWLIKVPASRVRWLPSTEKMTPTSASTDGVKSEGVDAAVRPTARKEEVKTERYCMVMVQGALVRRR